jgi:cysteinyl-tRNA synthetase
MSRRKEVFKPIEKGKVRLYTCGLTVYNYAHVGNLRAYVFVDLLRRWLEYRGFDVTHVMNLTDVDDKTIRGLREEGVPLKEYTERYIDAFFADLQMLNIRKAHINPKATEHVNEMVRLIEILLKKGYAYHSEDGSVYFDISKFKNYGKLSKMKLKELKAGARVNVDEYEKDQASDFALWRAWTPEDGDVYWETKLGKGRPGWHIECSAMSMKYLGETLDIHTGGVDNMFPHHENEIAQSEAATEKKFVNYWMHNEHLLIKGERMGKSLKNFYTMHDLVGMGYDPIAVRYLLLSTHYRKQLSFTFEALKASENTLKRLYDFMERLEGVNQLKGESIKHLVEEAKERFGDAMDDDLDINKALATVFDLVKDVNTLIDEGKLGRDCIDDVKGLMLTFDKVLGVLGDFWKRDDVELSKEIKALIQERENAREAKDWKTADFIREQLQKKGIILVDTPEGVKWKRERSRN